MQNTTVSFNKKKEKMGEKMGASKEELMLEMALAKERMQEEELKERKLISEMNIDQRIIWTRE